MEQTFYIHFTFLGYFTVCLSIHIQFRDQLAGLHHILLWLCKTCSHTITQSAPGIFSDPGSNVHSPVHRSIHTKEDDWRIRYFALYAWEYIALSQHRH
jgi:hypothetical protein